MKYWNEREFIKDWDQDLYEWNEWKRKGKRKKILYFVIRSEMNLWKSLNEKKREEMIIAPMQKFRPKMKNANVW